ncbi:MAG: IS66 family insertion sequence element accessory protein TnpB [Polyangiaceae bacterium]
MIHVALEPVDMRGGYERLGAIVRERMAMEPRSRALFVFVSKRGNMELPRFGGQI